MSDDLWSLLENELPRAAQLRRELHAHPELSGHEDATRDRLLAQLPPVTRMRQVAGTGLVARIGGEGAAIGIRGEMDALPIAEETGVPWASGVPGVMHACGHDVHLAAVSAVARAVAAGDAPAPLLVVLQPREETYPSGAFDITTSGLLEAEECRAMLGAHVQPVLEAGVVACVPGAVNASADEFEIVVVGVGGHAAYPHLTADPLLALSAIVVALQSVVSRSVDPLASAVVGVSSFRSGSAANAVPDVARATGTVRAMAPAVRRLVQQRIEEVAAGVAAAHNCRAEVTFHVGEPVLENDAELVRAIGAELQAASIPGSSTLRSLGADDFSYFSEHLPATMMFVGTTTDEPLHSARFLPGEEDLRSVARALLAGYLGAARYLAER